MAQNDVPLINGINYDWGSISFILFGVPVIGITKITYKIKQNKKNNYGKGYKTISRGYGNIEPEASIDIYTDELKRIIAASPGRSLLSIPPFDVLVTFGGPGLEATKDVLRSVEFLEDGLAATQDDTKLIVTMPLIVADIER